MMIRNFRKSVLLGAALLLSSGVFAALPWFGHGPRTKPVTLIVTANYRSPRLIAELIMNESRQPYMLLPPQEAKDNPIILALPKVSYQVNPARIRRAVEMVNPRRIIILGGENYVQQSFVDAIGRGIPVVRIEADRWQRVADELTFLLNLSNLDSNFRELSKDMANSLRTTPASKKEVLKPIEAPAPAPEAEAPAAEAASEVKETPAPAPAPAPAEEPAKKEKK